MPLRVLLVEDNPGDARLIEEMLRERSARLPRPGETGLSGADWNSATDWESAADVTLLQESRLDDALNLLDETPVDVVLLDLGLPDSTGLETLTTALEHVDELPFVVLTGLNDETVGVQAVQQGAQSYLRKDELGGELLMRSIRHALERHERERQLTALTTLSRDLMATTSDDELAELVVSAAADVLGFPVAMVCLYDPEQGRLRPAAATDDAAELLLADEDADGQGSRIAPALDDACRSAVGEVFARSRATVETGAAAHGEPGEADGPLRSRLVFPLGNHGVFLAGSTATAAVPSTTVDAARMLATNAQATLDRLTRARELRAREETLESQTESLERLNRINAVIRDVVAGVVHATSRTEIEQAVCDRLATAGPFRFVWIGAHDQLEGRVVPRASAGVEDGYLDSVSTATDDVGAGEGPVAEAVRTREPQVVSDAVTDLPRGSLREAARKRGYRSIAAIPLEYSETLYGVLTVYADVSGVFESEELAVFAELAQTIAHAINAVESKRALLGDRVVELEFEVRDERLLLVELTQRLDCSVAFQSAVSRDDDRLQVYFTTGGADPAAVMAYAEESLAVEELSLLSERAGDCVFECTLREPNLVAFCLDHGVSVQTLTVECGAGRAVFELANDAAVREFSEQFQATYPETTLMASREHERSVQTRESFQTTVEERLTDRQAEVLRTAFFSGYFESPRANSGREVAAELDIAQSTLNQHLRAAMRKLLTLLYAQ